MRQTVLLKYEDSVVIEFEGRQENVKVSGDGTVGLDLLSHGSETNLFDDGKTNSAWNNSHPALDKSSYPELLNTRDDMTKLEKIGHYLNMLYEAQKVDHAVHNEIDEALKLFKKEAGL